MLLNFSLNKDKFKKEFLYKKPYLFKGGVSKNNFTWNDVNEFYSRADISHINFKLMDGYEVPKKEYIEPYDNLGIIEYRPITPVLKAGVLFQMSSESLKCAIHPDGPAPSMQLSNSGLFTFAGGFPVYDIHGNIVGGVGVSGGIVEQDGKIAEFAS